MGTNALQSCYPFHGHMILPKGLSFCSSHCSTEQNLNHTHWWWNWCVEHNRMKQGYSILFLHGWQNIINERENTYKSFASVVIQKKLIHRSTSYKASPWCRHTSYVWQDRNHALVVNLGEAVAPDEDFGLAVLVDRSSTANICSGEINGFSLPDQNAADCCCTSSASSFGRRSCRTSE